MRAILAKPQGWWMWLAKAGAAHAIARAVLLIALVLLNPFGIVDWGERRTRDLWQEIYAEHYGPKTPPATAASVPGRDDITLILLDAEDRKLLNRADIPDSYDLFDMIDRVYRAAWQEQGEGWKPAAIFIDVQFSAGAPHGAKAQALLDWSKQEEDVCDRDPKATAFRCALIQIARITRYDQWRSRPECQVSTVAKLVCIRRHGGTPVLFAEPFTTDPAGPPSSEGARALDRVAAVVPAGFTIGRADLVTPADAKDRENQPYRLSPAAALYAIATGIPAADIGGTGRVDRRTCTPDGPILCPTGQSDTVWRGRYWGWSPAFDRPIETIWGIGGDDWFTDARANLTGGTLAQTCRVASTDGTGLALSFVGAFASGINPDRQRPCPYTHVLHYRHLGDASPPMLHSAIAGRLVMIGYADPEGNDYVPAGPHGDLPGVFHHAMTLDNLLVYGADYPRSPAPIVPFLDVTDSDLFNLGALLLILFPTALVTVWAEARNRRLVPGALPTAREWGWRLAALLLTIGFALSVVLILTGQLTILPPHYRAASLAIVVFLELFIILLILLRPIRDLLVARVSVLRFLFGETPPEPAALPVGPGHGVGDGDADDAADDGRAGG